MCFDSELNLTNDELPTNHNADRASDVEAAVIGHGKVEGPFTELAGLDIERDPAFPVRVTVQFYKATSNGAVSDKDVAEIRQEIDRVYSQAIFVGSLVTGGATGRPTEHDGDKVEPPDWWEKFWQRYAANTGRTRAQVIEEMRRRHGPDWIPLTEQALAQEAESWVPGATGLGRRLLPSAVVFGLGVAFLVLIRLYSVVRDRRRHALA